MKKRERSDNGDKEDKKVRFEKDDKDDVEDDGFKKPNLKILKNKKYEKDDSEEDDSKIPNISKKKSKKGRGEEKYDDEDNAQFERDNATGFIMHVDGEIDYEKEKVKLYEKEKDMGYEMEPFNLKEEMEGGDFNEEGFYIENKRGVIKDPWLDSIDNKKKFYTPKKKKEEQDDQKEDVVEERDEKKTILQLKMEIVKLLNKGETARKAMTRLSKEKNQSKTNKKGKIFITRNEDTKKNNNNNNNQANNIAESLDVLIEKANHLLSLSYYDAYDATKERLETEIELEKGSEDDWEYKDLEGTLFGPFSGEQMKIWMDQNYFPLDLLVRKKNGSINWSKISEVELVPSEENNDNNREINDDDFDQFIK
eukprot:TRINITY_DN644_c0_g2_i1.p1 TRINITY_DN644_c0_g2~~TRINITY_DN644_c0_g2_i1.p1  ORF type:complete len:366 (-),score=160.74 TRINITY_DN644_c0_g2_i1:301-1398(-)